MGTQVDRESIITAYQDVRNDKTDTTWAVFTYDDNIICHESSGTEYDDFKAFFSDDRAFGFVRLQTGDEMSKRVKFVLVTWMGSNVSAIKRAKMSTDKAQVKALIHNFAVEIQTNEIEELEYDYVVQELRKAGGANYGTGSRD